jgi:arylsulfatase A-like enzyme
MAGTTISKGFRLSTPRHHPESSWPTLAVVTILSIHLLVLMEWIFFVTKPSFLAVLDTGQRLVVLGLTPLPLLALATGLLIPLALAARLLRKRPRAACWFGRVAKLVPAFILGALVMLMVDNFSNTVLGWSLQRSAGFTRIVAVILVLCAFGLGFHTSGSWFRFFACRLGLGAGMAGLCLAASLATLVIVGGGRTSPGELGPVQRDNLTDPLPNILLLGSDGLSATHLSAYGYERATTPYLEELVPFSLFCENSFANCDNTTGSLASMLTGRLPTETRVTYPPDILSGEQAFQHLPGLLEGLGYFTEQICIRHYGDAFDVNMREGFDRAAFRDRGTAQASSRLVDWVGQEAGLFTETISDRIVVRLAHTAGLGALPSAFEEAVHADRLTGHTDAERYNGLVEVLSTAPAPFFVHTHFMATHGGHFSPSSPHFSEGKNQEQDWMTDFYDDAILEFDVAVGDLVETLRERGVLDNTLIIIYSDHGMHSNARLRTPLMFLFPGGKPTGRITTNVQNLDIAPTIVDFLGLEVPAWMHGRSLLEDASDAARPVFSTGFRVDALRRVVPDGPFEVDAKAAGPPFFSMGRVGMIVGQRVYSLDLVHPGLTVHDLSDHTSPLLESDLPTAESAGKILVDHLRERGWDVTGLPAPLPPGDRR